MPTLQSIFIQPACLLLQVPTECSMPLRCAGTVAGPQSRSRPRGGWHGGAALQWQWVGCEGRRLCESTIDEGVSMLEPA